MPNRTGKRDLMVIAGVAVMNGHLRYLSSSRGDIVQNVPAVFPMDEEGKNVTTNSYRLFHLPEPSTRAEALGFLVEQYKSGTAEHTWLSGLHKLAVEREAPKAKTTGQGRGKQKVDWFGATVEKTATKQKVSTPKTTAPASEKVA